MTALDVLVVESRPGAARHETEALEAAGHHVHSCHDKHASGFPCKAIDEGICPLDDGIDVAIVVRGGVNPQPTGFESGVSCVIRAGIPLLESGPTVLDPFAPYIGGRITGDPVAAVEAAAAGVQDEIAAGLRERSASLLAEVDVDPAAISSRVDRVGDHTRIVLSGPDMPVPLQHKLCVRMLDVVRGSGRTRGPVDVAYQVV